MKKYLPVYLIIFMLTLLIGTSYSLLKNTSQGSNNYVLNIGFLEVTFIDNQTSSLSLENAYPMTDIEGLNQENELVFVVKNTGNIIAQFDVYIQETGNLSLKSVLRFASSINDDEYSIPQNLSENNYIGNNIRININEEKTFKVKCWLSETADSTYMNNTFTAKVVVDASQDQAIVLSEVLENKVGTGGLLAINTNGDIATGNDEIREYRYSGRDVNNYISFNNEIWRIVGIFDNKIKIVRNGVLPYNYHQNIYYTNNLNETYELKTAGNYHYHYWNRTMLTGAARSTDWTKSGLMYYLNEENGYLGEIAEEYENLIDENAEYYLVNVNNWATTKAVYFQERATPVECANTVTENSHENSCNIWNGNHASWTGKIGLLYASDYGYSTDSQYWIGNDRNVGNYSTDQKLNSWLTKDFTSVDYFWFISPWVADINKILYYDTVGYVYYNYAENFNGVLPTAYLKANTQIVNANVSGSIDDPYVLKLS